ncbi:MAG TPA: TlpA family protein disulfide reductase [Polyangiaceae bacterium]|nr:TlpA family protein disulfide reductase [Polyangiaceae bacterium]
MKRYGTLLLVGALSACAANPTPTQLGVAHRGEALDFGFGALDGSVVTGENTRGRVTALLFVTTYDLPSQVAARRLGEVVSRHTPRVNAVAIVLEAAENAPLVDVFRSSLRLRYPVAIADVVELRGSAAFSNVDRVPTLVLLDRQGREVRRHFGGFDAQNLRAWLREAQR